jgi:predicted enzyme related to lactoylglutathione lyase
MFPVDAHIMATIPAQNLSRAKQFYAEKLGLVPEAEDPVEGALYICGEKTIFLLYETPYAGTAAHTLASFVVNDIEATVTTLRSQGVVFEEYDFPGLKTVNGIATLNQGRSAWFKDSEGNILAVTERTGLLKSFA